MDRLSIFAIRESGDISQGYTITRQSGLSNEHMSKSFVTKVLEVDDAVLFDDAQELSPEEWGTTIVQQGVRSIMGVPITLRGKSVAVLLADNLETSDVLDKKHLGILQFVAKAIEVVYQRDVIYKLDNLGKFLPICCVCKKIRDDKGYWNQIEAFIDKRADVAFSHGYCPECADAAMAELDTNG